MRNELQKILILEGLDCAVCAEKIRVRIADIVGVSNVQLDFLSKKLIIELVDSKDVNRIIEEAINIVKKLEPDVKIVEAEESKDNNDNNRNKKIIRIIVSGFLFFIALIVNFNQWIKLSIYILSYLIISYEVLFKAVRNIFKGQVFDENFLMSIASIGAFIIGEYPEAVAVMLFYQIGELFQDIAVNHSKKSINALMKLRPDYANLKVGNDYRKVSPEEVKIGDIVIVKPGEKVPLDGKIIEGSSSLDTSAITGESIPRDLTAGDEVLSGYINCNGMLVIEVQKVFKESAVSKIIDLIQNASSKKAQTENFITKFARFYTPVVVITALFIAVIPTVIIRDAVFSDWLYRALIFLVISCPCALVISIPLGFFGGIGGASKQGILIKGSNYLEALNNAEIIIFDKTGTLTKGVFKVTSVNPYKNFNKEKLIEYAAYAESYSNHPIALSINKFYGKEIDRNKISNYNEISGYGVSIKIDGIDILAGNAKLMDRENIRYSKNQSSGTIVYIVANGEYIGNIVISDEIKEDSIRAIKELKQLHIRKTVMLTGDVRAVGEEIGKTLGIDEIFTELLPSDKVDKLEEISKNLSAKGKLIFIGDGINDAPVLARADIGIAMGGLGSDAAIEASDIVIMNDELSKIPTAILIARRTRKIVWQNIIFALGIKLLFLTLGALGIASMWEAVFADVGVSIIAILNSMRVLKVKKY